MIDLTFTRFPSTGDADQMLVVGPSLGTSVETLWGSCTRLLGDRYEVVGWDLPGHGRSRPAQEAFTVAQIVDVVREHTERLAGGRPAWYAGVSFGGVVAFELAREPGPVRAVAAVAALPRIGDEQSWRDRADLVRRAGTPVMIGPSAVRWFAPGFTDREPDTAGALLNGLHETDSASYAWACEALAIHNPQHAPTDAKVPVLVAPGEHDVVIDLAPAQTTAEAVPGASWTVLAGCGHLPPAESPTATATALRTFFEEASS